MPGRMQVTLVSHYGAKPRELAVLIRRCQSLLTNNLVKGFSPYRLHQVHGTIIGLEGHRKGGRIVNRNSADLGAPTYMEPAAVLRYLREAFTPIDVQIGGFCPGRDYGFKSRGEHPYERSFSIEGNIAVAMGWPVRNQAYPNSIDELRWLLCRRLGVRHRWHRDEAAKDNDFYFVLGRLGDGDIDRSRLRRATDEVRGYLSGLEALPVRIDRNSLRIVAYLDERLPPDTSCALALDDTGLTPERLLGFYPLSESERGECAAGGPTPSR